MFILVSSRNNYQLFENFFLKNNSLPFEKIINVDTGSNETQKSFGRNICNSNKINFEESVSNELQLVINDVIDKYINKTESKWILCLHSDSFLRKNDYQRLCKLLSNRYFDKFGMIGLNTIFWPHTIQYQDISFRNFFFGLMGKSILSKVNYSIYGPHTIKSNKIHNFWNNLVGVDTVVDIGYLINIELFKKFINPSKKFPFVCAVDDLGMQFLKNDIFNVTLPDYYCIHDPWVKKKFKLPVSSPKELKKNFNKDFYNDDLSYEIEWKRKWKFDRQFKTGLKKPIVNNNFIKKLYTYINNFARPANSNIGDTVRKYYTGTLIGKFIDHDNDRPPFIFKDYDKFKMKKN